MRIKQILNAANPVCPMDYNTGKPKKPGMPGCRPVEHESGCHIYDLNNEKLYKGMGVGNRSQGMEYWKRGVQYKLHGKVPQHVIDQSAGSMRTWRATNVSTTALLVRTKINLKI